MKSIRISQLARILNGKCITTNDSVECKDVSIDSRTIESGQVFFAISGENFDGHDYVRSVIEKGASCVVIGRQLDDLPHKSDTGVISVDDTITALGRLAGWYRQQLSAKVIGITGSVGKTTTRQILYQILSRFFKCRQAPGSFNNHIGLPLTILSAEPEDEVLLLEMGSNRPGEIEYLTGIARPDMALVTMAAAAHLEGFGSVEAIIEEKASIAKGLAGEGTLYINGDQSALVDYVKGQYDVRTVSFGTNSRCDVMGKDLKTAGREGSLVIEDQLVTVPLAGRANLMNVLAAWAICRNLRISLPDFIAAVHCLESIQMRLDVQDIGPLTVLNDCYNANPVSMENALGCLSTMAGEMGKRRVFVAGCMAELGTQSNSLHIELGRQTSSHGIDLLLAAGPCADQILEGASEAAVHSPVMQAFDTTEQLCDNLHKWIEADDIILVKGSRAANLEKAVARLQQLFADPLKESAEIRAE